LWKVKEVHAWAQGLLFTMQERQACMTEINDGINMTASGYEYPWISLSVFLETENVHIKEEWSSWTGMIGAVFATFRGLFDCI
jgi:hypothetical protein